MKTGLILSGVAALLLLIASQTLTIFVVQPIGIAPEGRTVVIPRSGQMRFIDSADGLCLRMQGNVNLLCRGMVLARLGAQDTRILARFPYSRSLYRISTGGKEFDR